MARCNCLHHETAWPKFLLGYRRAVEDVGRHAFGDKSSVLPGFKSAEVDNGFLITYPPVLIA